MSRTRHPSATDRVVARAISLAVHPAGDLTAAVTRLARVAGGDEVVLRAALARMNVSSAGRSSKVIDEAAHLLRLAVAEATDRRRSS